jgi:hypothetical protein
MAKGGGAVVTGREGAAAILLSITPLLTIAIVTMPITPFLFILITPPSRRLSRLRWTLLFGGEEEVAKWQWQQCLLAGGRDVIALAAMRAGGGQRDESGQGEEEDALMTLVAMLFYGGRRWGDFNEDNGKEEVVEEDYNNKTIAGSGGIGNWKGGCKESSRRTAMPTALTAPTPGVVEKLISSLIYCWYYIFYFY